MLVPLCRKVHVLPAYEFSRSYRESEHDLKFGIVFSLPGVSSLMTSPFSAMTSFCAAQSYAPLTAK